MGAPGIVIGTPLVVACGEDAIHCRTVQRAGKGAMTAEDMLRGFLLARRHHAPVTRWRLTVEWDGAPFLGWQRQDQGLTIQQTLEEALERMTHAKAPFTAAGRTDAGVHALAMPVHVDIARDVTAHRFAKRSTRSSDRIPSRFSRQRRSRTNGMRAFPAPGVAISTASSPADRRRRSTAAACGISRRSSITRRCSEAAAHLVGRHDFTTFRSVHCQSDSPLKTLDLLDVTRDGDEVHIRAEARSFLHHQVRSMTGCLAMVGRGQWSADDMKAALEARDRNALGFNAPPQGLYFAGASYPAD